MYDDWEKYAQRMFEKDCETTQKEDDLKDQKCYKDPDLNKVMSTFDSVEKHVFDIEQKCHYCKNVANGTCEDCHVSLCETHAVGCRNDECTMVYCKCCSTHLSYGRCNECASQVRICVKCNRGDDECSEEFRECGCGEIICGQCHHCDVQADDVDDEEWIEQDMEVDEDYVPDDVMADVDIEKEDDIEK
jgi:hypothetical protein